MTHQCWPPLLPWLINVDPGYCCASVCATVMCCIAASPARIMYCCLTRSPAPLCYCYCCYCCRPRVGLGLLTAASVVFAAAAAAATASGGASEFLLPHPHPAATAAAAAAAGGTSGCSRVSWRWPRRYRQPTKEQYRTAHGTEVYRTAHGTEVYRTASGFTCRTDSPLKICVGCLFVFGVLVFV